MCLYSRDVDRRVVEGPYRSEDAELYARCVLLPDEEFEGCLDEPDARLAVRFRVPIEQVSAKRRDLSINTEKGVNGGAE
jgi:hypothetical protein